MRVKLRKMAAGPDFVADPGTIRDFPEDEALALIESEQADAVDDRGEIIAPPPRRRTPETTSEHRHAETTEEHHARGPGRPRKF